MVKLCDLGSARHARPRGYGEKPPAGAEAAPVILVREVRGRGGGGEGRVHGVRVQEVRGRGWVAGEVRCGCVGSSRECVSLSIRCPSPHRHPIQLHPPSSPLISGPLPVYGHRH